MDVTPFQLLSGPPVATRAWKFIVAILPIGASFEHFDTVSF